MFQPALFDFPPRVMTIRAINAYIRQKFEADVNLQDVWLEGEISNWKRAASGHIYFTMKDSGASIRCVIWRSQAERLLYTPQREGEAVVAHGRMDNEGTFVADKILAKHDENYMAPEVAESLAKHVEDQTAPLQDGPMDCNPTGGV